tara:strand:+ start:961 stop:2706 length:1746 start_codon:yes stop_codon:yes gene_type:complete
MVKKKNGKTTNKKGGKQGPKSAAWSSFTFVTVCTIIIFWVLFPFYSYQLQIIFDQEHCKIPSDENGLPYCPFPGAIEKNKGPNMFTAFIKSFGDTLKNLYEIITGTFWVELKKSVIKLEDKMNVPPKTTKGGYEHKSGGDLNGLGGGGPNDQVVETPMKILSKTLHINHKNFVNMATCVMKDETEMINYYGGDIKQKAELSTEKGFFSKPPMDFLSSDKFGWPYYYIFDASGTNTQYNPDGNTNNTMKDWVGAWFGKTQQRSWSTMRGLWSRILLFFLPFLKDEVSKDDIIKDLDAFIDALGVHGEIQGNFEKIKERFNNIYEANEKSAPRDILFSAMKDSIYDESKTNIVESEQTDKTKPSIKTKLVVAMNRLSNIRSGSHPYVKPREGDSGGDNIYLRFFIAAIRNAKYDKLRWFSTSIGLGGDSSYWMRYIITWYIPILTMVIMTITMFFGFWLTVFSSVNRYSSTILPFFFGIWVSFYNMFMLPTSLFWYFIVGGTGKRPNSDNCPYDSGVYQMRRNFWQYLPLNLYLTLGIISMQLGSTLTIIGKPTVGLTLTFLFPALVILVIIYRLLSALFKIL